MLPTWATLCDEATLAGSGHPDQTTTGRKMWLKGGGLHFIPRLTDDLTRLALARCANVPYLFTGTP